MCFNRTQSSLFYHIQKHSKDIEGIAILTRKNYACYVNYCELCVSTGLRVALFLHVDKVILMWNHLGDPCGSGSPLVLATL